jgi:diacylglycerol kinase family enzyme
MIYLAVNRYSGSYSKKKMNELEPLVRSEFEHYDFIETVKSGDKVSLGIDPEIISENDIICAVGGDGTINACLQYIHDKSIQKKVLLGIIPMGTGNNMIGSLGLKKGFGKAVHIISKGETEKISYGTVNGEKVFFNCSIGFSSHVLKNRKTNSLTGYFYDSLRLFPSYKGCRINISGREKPLELFAGFFMNTKVYMSKFKFLKRNNDGVKLGFYYIEKGNLLVTPAKAAAAFFNSELYNKIEDKKFLIDLGAGCEIETDGDIFSLKGLERTVTIENRSQVNVITNNKIKDRS